MTEISQGFISFCVATWFHVRDLARERSDVALNLITPVFYAYSAYFLYMAGDGKRSLIDLMIGAGLMGMWSTVMFGAGTVIKTQRVQGTLEFLLGSPRSLSSSIAPITTAASLSGMVSMLVTLLWSVAFLGVHLELGNIPEMFLAAAATTGAMGTFALLVAALFVQARRAESLVSPMIAPLWMVSGILIPTSSLVAPLRPISLILPMSWGAEALRGAAAGSSYLPAIGWCIVTSFAYLILGSYAVNFVAKRSRSSGEANLW